MAKYISRRARLAKYRKAQKVASGAISVSIIAALYQAMILFMVAAGASYHRSTVIFFMMAGAVVAAGVVVAAGARIVARRIK